MARMVSLGIIAALIGLLGLTFYQFIAPFLWPICLAATVALLSQPLLRFFLKRHPGKRSLAAVLTTASMLLAVMIPLLGGIVLGAIQLQELASRGVEWARDHVPRAADAEDIRSNDLRDMKKLLFSKLDAALGNQPGLIDREIIGVSSGEQDSPSSEPSVTTLRNQRREWFDRTWDSAQERALDLLKTTGIRTLAVLGSSGRAAISETASLTMELIAAAAGMLIALIVFGLALHYFLAEGPELVSAAQALIPVDRRYQDELLAQFENSLRAVVLATFLAAAAQGMATAIAMRVCGIGPFLLILVLATVGAFVPFAGTALVWVPGTIWLAMTGHWGLAIFLAAFCLVVVGMLDNVVRTWVLKNDTSLHPLMAFVSVLGGLQVMGLWGVFIGPVVACCLQSLVKIFNDELKQMSDQSTSALSHQDDQKAAFADSARSTVVIEQSGPTGTSEEKDKGTTRTSDTAIKGAEPKLETNQSASETSTVTPEPKQQT